VYPEVPAALAVSGSRQSRSR